MEAEPKDNDDAGVLVKNKLDEILNVDASFEETQEKLEKIQDELKKEIKEVTTNKMNAETLLIKLHDTKITLKEKQDKLKIMEVQLDKECEETNMNKINAEILLNTLHKAETLLKETQIKLRKMSSNESKEEKNEE